VSDQARVRFRFWFRLFVVASIVRGGWLAANAASLRSDPDTYRQLARNLLADGTFGYRLSDPAAGRPRVQPTAYRPSLYPLVLAAVGWVDDVGSTGVAILHWIIGVATVLLVYRLSQDWGLGRWGLLAAMLVACDPILLNQSSLVMTETLAALLAVVALLCLTRSAAATESRTPEIQLFLAGASVALAALCRPTFLVWAAAVGLALLLSSRTPYRRRFRLAGVFALSAGAVLAPWAIRNACVFDRFLVTTTHGGYTLWLGNNPEFYRFLEQSRWGDVWDSRHLDQQYLQVRRQYGNDELRADRWAYDQAVATISHEPAGFLRACIFRVSSLWGVVPHQVDAAESVGKRWARYAVGAWYAAILVLAVVGVDVLGRQLCYPPWLWGLLLCLTFTAMHTIYWSNLRMRAPLMPVICLAATVGVRWIASRTSRTRAAGQESSP
jgi:4-amino-4-deoxy-L-arabinose transferase-like glycosyltransferase